MHWLVIGMVSFLVALGTFFFRPGRDLAWADHLARPGWLRVVEPAIPWIWSVIFTCGTVSAGLVWQQDPGSLRTEVLMGLYLLLEVVTVAYIPLTLRSRSLALGTLLGVTGITIGFFLTLMVWLIDPLAAVLLFPYVAWSPIGTYATGQLIDLNPDAA